MVPFEPRDLQHHPSADVRAATAVLAVARGASELGIVTRLASDSSVEVRTVVASHVDAVEERSAETGVELRARLAGDPHAGVRWVAEDSRQQCQLHRLS
jgi:hypothetical protein